MTQKREENLKNKNGSLTRLAVYDNYLLQLTKTINYHKNREVELIENLKKHFEVAEIEY